MEEGVPAFTMSSSATSNADASAKRTVNDSDEESVAVLRTIPKFYAELRTELAKRIIGQDATIRDLFIALLAQGHCLMVGVPGLAKTLLVNSLAEASDLQFRRIQFTPDLMPTDVTGSEILD